MNDLIKIDYKKLGDIIARKLFECGDGVVLTNGEWNTDAAQRIEFKGGTYPDSETNLGGFCEKSLARFFMEVLLKELK